jgi:hypothetical protein
MCTLIEIHSLCKSFEYGIKSVISFQRLVKDLLLKKKKKKDPSNVNISLQILAFNVNKKWE